MNTDYVKNQTPLLYHPHFLIPSLNCSVEYITKSKIAKNYVFEYIPVPFKCSLPAPLGVPAVLTENSIQGIDHVTKLVNDKHIWELNKEELIAKNVKLKSNKVYNTRQKNCKKLPAEILKLAEYLELDPDPKFSGFYNWHYSDGCLNNIFHNNKYSILYVHENLPGSCAVTYVNTDKSECTLINDSTVFLRTGHKQRIFQINVINNFIAVRQRNFASLFTVTDDWQLKFKKIHKHSESKDSIASVSVSNDLDGEYCSLTTSYKLKLWSPEVKDECINCVKVKKSKSSDRWGNVKYSSSNNILVSTRSCVYLKDTRMNLEQNAQKWKMKVRDKPCEFITLMLNSKSSDSEYIGTTHSLFELDFRKGFSKLWTHMMELPPMYGTVDPVSDSSEMVFIGSQSLNEICAVDANQHVMPYLLPSPDETRTKLNLKGLCLDPTVSSRFSFSMVGMTAIPDNNRNDCYFILRSNSVGDVFYQRICKNEPNDFMDDADTIDLEMVSKWESICVKSIASKKNTPLKVTTVIDFSRLNKNKKGKTLKNKDSIKRKKPKIQWILPKYRNLNARDPFTQSLINIWDVDNTDELADHEPTIADMSSTDDEQCNQNISNQNVTQNIGSESNIANETFNFSNSQLGLHMNETNILRRDSIPANTDIEIMRGNNLLNFEDCDDMYNGSCSTYPNKVIQNKSGKVGAKSKTRFSSGF